MEAPNTNETPQTGEERIIPDEPRRPSTFTVIVVFVLFLVLLAVLFVVGYIPHERSVAQARNDAADHANALPVVAVTKPKEQNSTRDVVLPCDLRPNQETAIYSRANGYVKKLYVDINDHVKEGQLLAEIDTPEVDAQLNQSRANLEQAKANLNKAKSDEELARRTVERYKDLPPGTVSNQELDQRQATLEAAVATVSQTAAAIKVAEADVQRLTVLQGFEKVVAPFAGTITARNYDVGALANPANTAAGQELFRLAQSSALKALVYVPQTWSTDIRSGQPALLDVRNYPQRQFKGTVARASGALNPATRTMLYEIEFDNPEGVLAPGMYGQIRLTIQKPEPVLLVPTAALVFNASGTQVATLRDGKVHMKKVQVGRDFGTELEIISGLAGEDEVITNPAAQLAEGTAVRAEAPQKAVAERSNANRPGI